MHGLANRLIGASLAAALLGGFSACADVLDIPEDPQLVATGPWRCLSSPSKPSAPVAGEAVVKVKACNFVSTNCTELVSGLTASLCNKRDVNCSAPVRMGITDSGGELRFSVPTGGALGEGFDGYLQLASPRALCTDERVFGASSQALCALSPGCDPEQPDEHCMMPTFAPSMLFFNPEVRKDSAQPIVLPMVPTAAIQPILAASGQTSIDPTTGFLFITAMDCDQRSAAGVRFKLLQHQDVVTQLYVDDGVISATTSETDSSGLAGFIDVPAGFVTVVGSVTQKGRGSQNIGEVGVQAAPFTITYSAVVPAED